MTLKDIETPQPHFIPGYTGYCPQFIYRVGDTYGQLTHKLIIDPNVVPHAEKLIISNRIADDYHVKRPILREIDVIRRQHNECFGGDRIYKYPMVPGYEGFIPKRNGKFGQRFSIAATESLAQHQSEQLLRECERRKLKHRGALQNANATNGRSLGERSLTTNDYKLPLNAVRPDRKGVIREVDVNKLAKAPPLPYSRNRTPPHFMNNDDPEKYLKLGYSGHQPFAWPRFGYGNKPLTNSALCEFTNNYQHRRSTEWAPITNAGVGSSARSSTSTRINGDNGGEIYHKNIGLIPNYAGHVPGAMFRFGQTYGNDSRDAKRWLRGDFTS